MKVCLTDNYILYQSNFILRKSYDKNKEVQIENNFKN